MRSALYPYGKQNLIPYRLLSVCAVLVFLVSLAFGILQQRPTGLGFMIMVGFFGVVLVRGLFSWNSEPTARRQYATALVLTVLYGMLGGFALDATLIRYHLWRGECPVWMDFSGRCIYPYPDVNQAYGRTVEPPQAGQPGSAETATVRAVPARPS